MKKLLTTITLFIFMCGTLNAQNITNTLGSTGVFSIKDNTNTFLSLNQSNGTISLISPLAGNQRGSMLKGGNRFLHTYHGSGTPGLNTFLGIDAGNFTLGGSGTQGSYNTGVGVQSLVSNTTGSGNSAFGLYSLFSNSVGNFNTAIGYYAGSDITAGNFNIAIGNNAQVPNGNFSNQIRLGNTSITYAGIQVAWTVTSDRSLKSSIFNSNLGLGFITKLRPVYYTRKNDENAKIEYGLIAQEVEEVLLHEGAENTGMLTITDKGEYQLRYNDLIAPMIKAIQELKEENENLKAQLNEVKLVVYGLKQKQPDLNEVKHLEY